MENKEYWDSGKVCRKCSIPYTIYHSYTCEKCGASLDFCAIKCRSIAKWYNLNSWGRYVIVDWKDQ